MKKRKPKITNKTQFIKEAKKIHGNKYDYSKVDFINTKTHIKIICPLHGEFLTTAKQHIYRQTECTSCSYVTRSNKRKRFDTVSFKEILHEKYPDLILDNVKYINSKEKVKLICPIHGKFERRAEYLLNNVGCTKCKKRKYFKKHDYYSDSNWEKRALKSKKFDSFKVYIIKCFDVKTNEKFYKIGKTFRTVKERFQKGQNSIIPYSYKIIKIIESDDYKYICNLERVLLISNAKYKYVPLKDFRGMYECFSKIKTINDELS